MFLKHHNRKHGKKIKSIYAKILLVFSASLNPPGPRSSCTINKNIHLLLNNDNLKEL